LNQFIKITGNKREIKAGDRQSAFIMTDISLDPRLRSSNKIELAEFDFIDYNCASLH
jgi:hypothetical protein